MTTKPVFDPATRAEGRANFRRAVEHIKAHPETWKQNSWHCGTSHCIAGHGQIMAGKVAGDNTARRDARIFFDLSSANADWLFLPDRTIADFEKFLTTDGFGRDGRDHNGRDRDGRDHNGRDRDGRDHNGRDRDGFGRDGFDRDGLGINNKPRPVAS